eukprot:COSAG02_NODE_1278_length_13501_cov_6.318087_3_plen_153_part_00
MCKRHCLHALVHCAVQVSSTQSVRTLLSLSIRKHKLQLFLEVSSPPRTEHVCSDSQSYSSAESWDSPAAVGISATFSAKLRSKCCTLYRNTARVCRAGFPTKRQRKSDPRKTISKSKQQMHSKMCWIRWRDFVPPTACSSDMQRDCLNRSLD